MENSGCRTDLSYCSSPSSDEWKGSGGLALDTPVLDKKKRDYTIPNADFEGGNLIVSEVGQYRIVRIEKNGARTPLVQPVLAVDLVYNPTFHDLCFTTLASQEEEEEEEEAQSKVPLRGNQLYCLRALHKIPPILNQESRLAHFYSIEKVMGDKTLDVIYGGYGEKSQLGGVALSHNYDSVFVMELTEEKELYIMKVMLEDEEEEEFDEENDDDDDYEEGEEEDEEEEEVNKCKSSLFFNATRFVSSPNILDTATFSMGGIQIDTHGNLYVAIDSVGILVIDSTGQYLGTITIPPATPSQQHNDADTSSSSSTTRESITNLAFGEDAYLYVTTTKRLLRLKVHENTKGMTTSVMKDNEYKGMDVDDSKIKIVDWKVRCGSSIP